MKKLKNIDFKALFINHGEKFALGFVVMLVLVALSQTSWTRYAGTPEELSKKAIDARQRFTSPTTNPWPKEKIESFRVVDYTDRANQLFVRLDPLKYEFAIPLTQPLYRRRELSREPDYLAVEYLIAHAGKAILRVAPPAAGSSGSEVGSEMPAPGSTTPEESETGFKRPGGATGGAVAPAAGHGATAPMPGQVAVAPTRMPAGAHGAAMMPMEGMPGSSFGTGATGGTARGVRYIAVRGVFPLKQQLEKIQSALKLSSLAEANAKFELLDLVLERQVAGAGSNPWKDPSKDENWEVVNIESALDILSESPDYDPDPVQTGITDSVITMPLPNRLLEFWGDHATHPNIRDFQLKPEEMEREMKLQEKVREAYEKAALETKPPQKGGFSREVVDVRSQAQQLMAMPSGAHGGSTVTAGPSMQDMMRGMMTSANEMGMPRLTEADIKQRLTANGRLLLFRYFDFDVQPGLAYRYRVKLKLKNPNYERPPTELVDPALASAVDRETPWSNISMPAVVPTSTNYFLKDVERDPSRDDKVRASKAVASISMFEWDSKFGMMLHDTLRILSVGQFISEKKKSVFINPAVPSYEDDAEVAFVTGDVLLDATGDLDLVPDQHPDLGIRPDKGKPVAKLGLLPEAVVMTSLGEMKQLDPVSERSKEQSLKKRVDAERNEFKGFRKDATQTGSALDTAGSSLYDQMMNGPAAEMPMPMAPGKKSPRKKGGGGEGSGSSHAGPDNGAGKSKAKRPMMSTP